MLKKSCVLFVALFFIGCAHHTKNTVGGMYSSLETGLTVHHQYQIETTYTDKEKRVIHSYSAFGSDLNTDLPSNTVSLDLLMAIVNPHKQKIEVWERVNYIDLETDEIFYKSERLRYKPELLPEELISISFGLPMESDKHCRVVYYAYVKDSMGENIYHTYTARYKIAVKN